MEAINFFLKLSSFLKHLRLLIDAADDVGNWQGRKTYL
jgi:hypothetical protein